MITHLIIHGSKYQHDIPYRQHRLAKFLAQQEDTEAVIWISSSPLADFETGLVAHEFGISELTIPSSYSFFRLPRPFLDEYPFNKYVTDYAVEQINGHLSDQNFLWFTKPHFTGLIDRDDLWDRIIYDCSDDHTSMGWKRKEERTVWSRYYRKMGIRLMTKSEATVLKKSDVVIASSIYLQKKFLSHGADEVELIETGVDFELFERNDYKYTKIERLPSPKFGFVGAMKEKIDFELLHDVACKKQSWNFILIGPKNKPIVPGFDDLIQEDNVYWIDGVNLERIPSVMNSLDVGLMPYKDIEYNQSVFPLKYHEYLAAGLPVVGCGLPSTKHHEKEGVYLHISNETSDVISGFETALSWSSDYENIRIKTAREADWGRKFELLYEQVVKQIN